jgi:hypothetical protein
MIRQLNKILASFNKTLHTEYKHTDLPDAGRFVKVNNNS